MQAETPIKIMWLVLGGLMAWYLSFYFHVSFAPDLSILVSFAERMMQGELYSQSYYDTNPPLSMIIFIPPVWVAEVTGWPVYHVHFFYSLGWMALSFTLTALLLKRLDFIESHVRHMLLMIFVLTQIFAPDRSIGDREHIIILGLIPMLLAQFCITKDIKLPTLLKYTALIFGTLGILIKPHYGIFPVLFLIDRMGLRKDLSVIKDADFISLAVGVIGYALLMILVFPDYLSVVMPDVVQLYVWQKHPLVVTESLGYSIVLAFFFFAACMGKMTDQQYKLLLILGALTLCAFVPYMLQAKALNYQRIPYLTFLYLACGYATYLMALNYLKPLKAVLISVLLAGSVLYVMRSVPIAFPTHDEFKNLPMSEALEKHCEEPCEYVLWYDFSDIVHQLAIYHDAFHASRFTSNWFTPRIRYEEKLREDGERGELSDQELQVLKDKYAAMVVEDFKRFKPQIVMAIYKEGEWNDLEFFERYDDFKAVFSDYKKNDEFSFKRLIYYPGYISSAVGEDPIVFHVYKRKDLINE